jgi:hypothetical protein
MNRIAATVTITVPAAISVKPARSPKPPARTTGGRAPPIVSDYAAILRKRLNLATRNPNAMTAMAVRTQARNVRSLAA